MSLFWIRFFNVLGDNRCGRLGLYLAAVSLLASFAGWSFSAVLGAIVATADVELASPEGMRASEARASQIVTSAAGPAQDGKPLATAAANRADPGTEPAPRPAVVPARVIVSEYDDPAAAFHTGGLDTYRTVCVRLCDGYYWPISFSTTPDGFRRDRDACENSCGGSPTRLFVHAVPGGSPERMQDLAGQPYTRLKTAFRFQTTYDAACKCSAHPWEQQAKDRHRAYTLEAAQRKGDRQAGAELAALRTKIESDARAEVARTRASNDQLVSAGIVAPSHVVTFVPSGNKYRRRPPKDDAKIRLAARSVPEGMMGLGQSVAPAAAAPARRTFSGAVGSGGSSWNERAFSGGNN